jgi:hypothetical protein
MQVKLLSLAMPDGAELLSNLASTLAGHGINIITLHYVESEAAGVANRLELLVNDPEKAHLLLAEAGYGVEFSEVVVVEIPDKPGGLAWLMQSIQEQRLAFQSLHVFSHRTGERALIAIAFREPARASQLLSKSHFKVLSAEQLLAR